MKQLKTFFKWKYLRRKIRFRKYLTQRTLNINEKLIKSVLIKVVADPDNNILINPISNTIYIQTKNKEYTIVLSKTSIKIANHQLFIESKIDEFFSDELFDVVYFYLEKFKTKMDNEIFNNEVEGLNYMLNQLNQLK
jgi:hypothetical protein